MRTDKEKAKMTQDNIVATALSLTALIRDSPRLNSVDPFVMVGALSILCARVGIHIGMTENSLVDLNAASLKLILDTDGATLDNVVAFRPKNS